VYTIEIVEPLGRQAAETLRRLGYTNVFTKIGDGYAGWPEHAPFDKIIVTCSPEDIPQPLVDQLADGGLLIVPVGQRFQQTLCRFKKTEGRLEREPLQATFFVPMTGQSEAERQVKPDLTKPTLVNGSFETTLDNSADPDFWYYLREGRVQADPSAPDGKHVLRFDNRVAGRSAQALQAFGVDGSQVHRLEVRLQVQAKRVRSADQPEQSAQAVVEFYGADRAAVGRTVIGPWSGSFAWKPVTQEVDVPPSARLAVIGVGLFGATGQLAVDQVSVEAH
jgi:protein-L-isoaspartate(D-aspartate) O-methyltransferase